MHWTDAAHDAKPQKSPRILGRDPILRKEDIQHGIHTYLCVRKLCIPMFPHWLTHTHAHAHTHRHIQVHSMTVSDLTIPGSSASSFTCARLTYVTGVLAGNGKTARWPASLPARRSFPPSLPPTYPPICALGPVCLPLLWGLYARCGCSIWASNPGCCPEL